jgi:hypothetical protein
MARVTGEMLKRLYRLPVKSARYRATGDWYHSLDQFPAALLDARGCVIFRSKEEFENCLHLKMGPAPNQVHAVTDISRIPGYFQLDPHPINAFAGFTKS